MKPSSLFSRHLNFTKKIWTIPAVFLYIHLSHLKKNVIYKSCNNQSTLSVYYYVLNRAALYSSNKLPLTGHPWHTHKKPFRECLVSLTFSSSGSNKDRHLETAQLQLVCPVGRGPVPGKKGSSSIPAIASITFQSLPFVEVEDWREI